MASRRLPESVPLTLTPHKAIELLRQRVADFDRIKVLRRGDPEINKWENTTEAALHAALGKPNGAPHEMTQNFTRYHGSSNHEYAAGAL
jgi:hypothetical protein